MKLSSSQGSGRASAATKKTSPAHKKTSKSGGSGGRRAAVTAGIIAAVLILACACGVVAANNVETVYPNVTLNGMDIGGMTDVELSKLLLEKNYEGVGDQSVTVSLPTGYELTVKASEVCTDATVADIVDNVMDACRGGSALENALTYVKCLFWGMELESGAGLSVDSEAVRAKVEEAANEVSLRLMSSEVTIGEDSLTVIKGASAVSIDTDELCELITDAFIQGNYDTIEYSAEVTEDAELDLDDLYEKVASEVQDAYYDKETGEIVSETRGLSFDMAEARSLWNAADYGDEVVIPLEVEEPSVTAEELSELLFRDCFCKKATSLSGSTSNRINNVTKAAAAINGTVLMPGEEFSYNDALGERTAENGYLPAAAYSGGETVQEYGGGICQVSSTLYYCALYANLEITARSCHMFPVGYLPPGLDATVSWGGPEFKFVNNRNYPVKIVSYVEGNEVTVELWGTDVDGSYVEMTYTTSMMYDSTYTDVAIGYKATTYRSVYDKDGNLISQELEARSTYNYHDENIAWPEESEEPEESTSPEESATPGTEATQTPGTETSPEPTQEVTVEPTQPVETEEPVYPDPPILDETA